MGNITLEQVTKLCGKNTSKSGENYFFQCPVCKDEHKDNLVYNAKKQIIKCFRDNAHTIEILRMINNDSSISYQPLRENQYSIKPKEKPVWEERQEQYIEYMRLTQDILLNRNDLLEYLYKKRGWTKNIIDLCGVGFDDTENYFTIPIFSLKYDCITDFELRQYGEKKIRRIGGGCSTIARIWGVNKAKTLIIQEGFCDGITLSQWLLDKKQTDFTIYSCSNGVNSLLNCLSEINFSNFKEIKLILDADTAGDDVTEKIIEKYPFIIDSRKFLKDANVKDISDYFIKKVRCSK